MPALYVTAVWVHLLAMAAWLGGMISLVVAVVPVLRRADRATAASFMHATGVRLRALGWTCYALLVLTGAIALAYRGVRWADLARADFWGSPLGRPLSVKLACFAVVLALGVWHDFVLGPRATRLGQHEPGGATALRLRRQASLVGRVTVLLALVIVACGVLIVRGWPW